MNDVDAEPSVIERHAAIDEHHLAALLDREAVHADFAETAEREDGNRAHRGGSSMEIC